MRIVLFGAGGQVGWELQRALAPLGEVLMPSRSHPQWPADLADPASLRRTLRELRPQAIVNAAAYTAVDRAETEPALAQAVNADAPGVMAAEAAESGALLVHYSSDYVFDGHGSTPFREDDAPAPLSVYGRSKLDGERAVRASGSRHLVLRTSWVCSARGGNFIRTILRLAAERDSLRVVDDQIGAPTGAELLADVTAHALRAVQEQPALCGTYHVAASGETSWHAYACRIVESAAARGRPLRTRRERIEPVSSRDYASAATRPLNSRLDTTRLQRSFGLGLPPWEHGVDRILAELLDAPDGANP